MRKMLLALAFSAVLANSAQAALYNLFSVNGAMVVGNGPFSAQVLVEETSPGFATPYPGDLVEALAVYFSDALNTPNPWPNPSSRTVDVTVSSGPSGPSFVGNGTSLSFSDDTRYFYSRSIFGHGSGDEGGVPDFRFVVSLPDSLSFEGVSPILAAVPEPSTWAMLLLGFAGIVAAGIRKRRKFELIPGIQSCN
jgi:hypothetical protein